MVGSKHFVEVRFREEKSAKRVAGSTTVTVRREVVSEISPMSGLIPESVILRNAVVAQSNAHVLPGHIVYVDTTEFSSGLCDCLCSGSGCYLLLGVTTV